MASYKEKDISEPFTASLSCLESVSAANFVSTQAENRLKALRGSGRYAKKIQLLTKDLEPESCPLPKRKRARSTDTFELSEERTLRKRRSADDVPEVYPYPSIDFLQDGFVNDFTQYWLTQPLDFSPNSPEVSFFGSF